jgi:hypothetical protein
MSVMDIVMTQITTVAVIGIKETAVVVLARINNSIIAVLANALTLTLSRKIARLLVGKLHIKATVIVMMTITTAGVIGMLVTAVAMASSISALTAYVWIPTLS